MGRRKAEDQAGGSAGGVARTQDTGRMRHRGSKEGSWQVAEVQEAWRQGG